MGNSNTHTGSLSDVHQSIDTTKSKSLWRKILAFSGPAYLVSVGYMDPGNWATDIAGGSHYGYALIWVLLMSNLMAILLQDLSARLGIVRGRDLAQANRETYPVFINFILYLLAEIAIAATDLAEVLGMAIGIQLLTGLPILYGVLITLGDTFLIFVLQRLGIRKMELFIVSLIAIIFGSFLIEIIMAKPDIASIGSGFIPHLPDDQALYIAIGIIGATVMPHNLYLHSALVQTRKIKKDKAGIRHALKMNLLDSFVALNLAFLVNAAILVLAAAVFFTGGKTEVADITDAYKLLSPMMGSAVAPILFAVALIAAGQSSTITGTLAGQIVMEGYLNLRINPLLRRLITRLLAIIPALLVILIAGESKIGGLLVFSQVLLSLQLAFAVIPLIHFVSNKKIMGEFVIKNWVKILSILVTIILVYLNIRMVINEISSMVTSADDLFFKILWIALSLAFVALLVATFVYPFFRNELPAKSAHIHEDFKVSIGDFSKPVYNKIAMALDFSQHDEKVIANAIAQGNAHTTYILIHIVESASTKLLGQEASDYETENDKQQLEIYVRLLKEKAFDAEGILGYNHRAREIVRIVKEQEAELLVLGGHGHKGIKDWIYGETVNYVRHYVHIPVLIINS